MLSISIVDYATHARLIHQVRESVFVQEQHIPLTFENDHWDARCIHVLATNHHQPIGTGRLLPDGYIGRVAVLASKRQRGIGTRIMKQLITAAHLQGHEQVALSAQCHAITFYHRLGFREEGQIHQIFGIDHIKMVKTLVPAIARHSPELSLCAAL